MFKFGSIIRSLTDFRRQRQPGHATTRTPYDANAVAPNGMTSGVNAQQVELAVRRAIHPGMRLHTPGRGYPPRNRMPFVVTAVDRTGVNTDKTMGHYVTWSELAGVAPYLHRLGGSALIGAHETQPEPGSLATIYSSWAPCPAQGKQLIWRPSWKPLACWSTTIIMAGPSASACCHSSRRTGSEYDRL